MIEKLDPVVLHGGRVLTMDPGGPAGPEATAVLTVDGRVRLVGSDADVLAATPRGVRRVDLEGATVLPGFNDAHLHLWKIGHLMTSLVDLRDVRSLGELAAVLRRFAQDRPQAGWIVGRGYNEAQLAEKRSPTRHDLDAALPNHAVFLTRTCGHIGVASTVALARGGVGPDTAVPAGGAIERDERGQPTGVLHETAMGLVNGQIGEPEPAEYEEMVAAAARKLLGLGITSCTDAGVTPRLLDVYRNMDSAGELGLRVNAMALRRTLSGGVTQPLPERTVTDFLRIDSVKLLVDGGLSGATAALSVPYRHDGSCGLLRLSGDELLELALEAHRVGLRVGAHAIGDVAIDAMLDTYEKLAAYGPGPAPRIEHFGLPSEAQLARAKRLGVIAVPQTIFLASLGVNFRRYLPDVLVPRAYPVKSMLDHGLVVALSSDAPVVKEESPLAGLAAALLRRDAEGVRIAPEQALTAEQALECYTVGGARASGDEANRGRVRAGQWADLVVLAEDPRKVDPERVADVKVQMTLVAGQVVFEG